MSEVSPSLAPVVRRLRQLLPGVATIALIGSRAVGTARPDSDWDLLVLAEQGVSEADRKRIRRVLATEFPLLKLDVLFGSPRWVVGNLENEPYRRYWLKQGIGLWGRWPLRRHYPEPQKRAMDSHLNLIRSEVRLADVADLTVAQRFQFYANSLKKLLMVEHVLDGRYDLLWPEFAQALGPDLWERYRPDNGRPRVTRKHADRTRRLVQRKLSELQAKLAVLPNS